MRERVLNILKKKDGSSYVSGEEMARALSVSRTSIWKAVNSLQVAGYRIESSPRLGYRLVESPDLLYPEELAGSMQTQTVAPVKEYIVHYHSLASTNETLKKMAEEGAPEGTVVLAEEQTKGRGRLGRSWSSPPGRGIWMSVLFRPSIEPAGSSLFTLFIAVAVVKSIKELLPESKAGIKWPNDILSSSRKLCGILTELKAEADLLHFVVAGIGVNVNTRKDEFPPELQGTATSLYQESGGKEFSRAVLTAKILEEIDRFYLKFLSEGTKPIVEAWKKHDLTLGKEITVQTPRESFHGRAVDIDKNGGLLVEGGKGDRRIFWAGEVTLRENRTR